MKGDELLKKEIENSGADIKKLKDIVDGLLPECPHCGHTNIREKIYDWVCNKCNKCWSK